MAGQATLPISEKRTVGGKSRSATTPDIHTYRLGNCHRGNRMIGNGMRVALAIAVGSLLTCCGGSPSRAFLATSFTEGSVFSGRMMDRKTGRSEDMTRERLTALLGAMEGIDPPQAAFVEPRYVLTLFTGSSFESQRMTVLVDENGAGYFQRGNGRKVEFHSSELAEILKSTER